MPADDPRLAALARAVLDGTDVNWPAVTADTPAEARPVVEELRLLAALGRVHRRPAGGDAASDETPAWFAQLVTESHPTEWGHLHVRALLGRGAAGAVYRAWDSRIDREVALKLLPVPAGGRHGAPSTFIEEGRLLARVRHPNVVTIHGAEQIGNQIGLWMELIDGRTLQTIVPPATTCSAREAIDIGTQLCSALAAVHDAGLLHGDVKATNVMRATDGRIVLMDFGAGRDAADSTTSDLTCTPLYAAPEVLRGEPATIRSDVYSAGVLFYRLLTGEYPCEARAFAPCGSRMSRATAGGFAPRGLICRLLSCASWTAH